MKRKRGKRRTRPAKRRRPAAPVRRRRRGPSWATLPDERLLDLRMCDLDLRIAGTPLSRRIAQLGDELARRGIRFRPHCWLADEWFTPDGVGGIAIPFYLAHPRLARLEERMMLEVEGGTHGWCMRILRHEAGHAIDNAYRLYRRREWQKLFGRSTQRYPDFYQPKPYSKRFVLHLDWWYAQSHPSEDFAETFAVWLNPRSRWRQQYRGWPAIKKLEYVDRLMGEIAEQPPVVRSTARTGELSTLRKTLREHYRAKQALYSAAYPAFYDRDLRRLFSAAPEHGRAEPAAGFLRRIRPDLRRLMAHWTGEYQYTIDQILGEMMKRCQELHLRAVGDESALKLDTAVMLAIQTMNYLHSGRHRVAL